ncbi:MAG: class I SAM-dependent methyltransferase [Armatimonadota bacterium]|nr:class I SAM-dependent methyltransferase [Armatimonadota bacterium]
MHPQALAPETRRELLALTEKVEGWLTVEEGELLYQLARACKGKGVIVEIGSFKGKSTIWLAKGSLAGAGVRVFAIDPHTGSEEHRQDGQPVWTYDEFVVNLRHAGVEEVVTPLLTTSAEAAAGFDQPVELLFIDGDHRYAAVRQDFDLWFPKLLEGGYLLMHDTIRWDGPRRVARESVYLSPHFCEVGFVHSITFGRKGRQEASSLLWRRRYLLLLHVVYDALSAVQAPPALKRAAKALFRRLQGKPR